MDCYATEIRRTTVRTACGRRKSKSARTWTTARKRVKCVECLASSSFKTLRHVGAGDHSPPEFSERASQDRRTRPIRSLKGPRYAEYISTSNTTRWER